MKCPVYPLDSGYLILPLYSIYRHLSSGNFSLFRKFQNNFRFLGQIAVLLDVDAAADVVTDGRRESNSVLCLFVFGECYAHVYPFLGKVVVPCPTLGLACTLTLGAVVVDSATRLMWLVTHCHLPNFDWNLDCLLLAFHVFIILYLSAFVKWFL